MKGVMKPYGSLLPMTLRPLFEPRPPLPYMSNPREATDSRKGSPRITGVADLMQELRAAPAVHREQRDEKDERKARAKANKEREFQQELAKKQAEFKA